MAGAFLAQADSDRYAVIMSATVQENPPQISLNWIGDEGTPGFPVLDWTVYRKEGKQPTDWGAPIAVLDASATNYTDTNVVVGQTYEYQIIKHATGITAYGYLWAGIRAPLIENRGTIVLLVDDTMAPSLVSEINRLKQDLAGDGWSVIRHDVSRNASVVSVKEIIRTDWKSYPNVSGAFLLGHIPVAYAGNIAPDEKTDHHKGAWPSDVYYGEMNGFWSDFFVNNTTADDPRNRNVPGDGKFDQSQLPSNVDLQVGRVDLANMPGKFNYDGASYFAPEAELLRQYLNKTHAFRHAQFTLGRRGIIHDGAGARNGAAGAATGWRAFSSWVGYTNVLVDTDESWLQRVSTNSFLGGFASDAGDYSSIGRVGGIGNFGAMTSAEMVSSNIQCGVITFLGSWLGDWDSDDNLMRGVLATTNYGLASFMGGTPHWFLHHIALGETLGFGARLSQNNIPQFYNNQISPVPRQVHVTLLGDPTLRLFMPKPPTNLVATVTATNVFLTWKPSPDANLGYHVYRSSSADGYFTRLAPPVSGTNYTDLSPLGTNYYMVRALNLETTGAGTYTNASQGIFASAKVTSAPPGQPLISSMFFSGSELRVQVIGNAGLNYALLASTNLADWESLTNLTTTNSPFEMADPNMANFKARYYKVSAQP